MESKKDVEMNGHSHEEDDTEIKRHEIITSSSVQTIDQYVHKLCLVVVAQLGKEVGFHSIQTSAADTLVDLLIRYMTKIGKNSTAFANLASRTQPNFFDVQNTLKEMNVGLEELRNYAASSDMPFLRDVPKFPVSKRIEYEIADASQRTHQSYVPDFLPPFPSSHTYKDTALPSLGTAASSDPKQERKTKTKQKKQLETALANLTAKIGNKPIINYEAAKVVTSNPFFNLTSKPSGEHRNRLVPTPIQRENPFFKSLKPVSEQPPSSGRDHFQDSEDHEREKRRKRAQAIFSETETSSEATSTSTNMSIQPVVEKI